MGEGFSMSESLHPYYESELYFIRRLAQEFARKYPAAAARLQLEPDRSTDPHVERLIEAFALLGARVRHKLHDEFPELTDAMLSVLYPHALAPVPSCAIVQFILDPARATPEGVEIKAGSPLLTAPVATLACKYRTCYPLKLWPVAVVEAKLHPPPFPSGLNPPARAAAALRLRLQTTGELTFDKLKLDRLRFHLLGDATLIAPLYNLILNHALEVAFVPPERPRSAVSLPADEALRPVGFEPDEGLLPYPPNVFPGYRLLTEYFAFPAKFAFVDVAGWDKVRRSLGPTRTVDLVIFLSRSHPRLEQLIEPEMFRTGCTPVVNLFELTAEPIPLTHVKPEYKVVPEVAHPLGYEVYSVTSVTAASTDGKDREYHPFYHFQHGGDRDTRTAFWYASRRPSLTHDDQGTDTYLHLVDAAFDPAAATNETLVVRSLCTNRDLPMRLPRVGEVVQFKTAFAAEGGAKVRCVRNPTPPLRPASPRGRYWHLVSHLNLNHLSLTDDAEGAEALRGLLRLYDLTDPKADPQAAALARQSIEGLVGVSHRRTTAWVGSGELGGFARGLEITLELDEEKFGGGVGGFLFASVLERFFGLYVSVNSFTQLVAKFRQHDTELRRWPPRAGEQPIG
jgi:type VI secretion system protein ImpG